MLMATYYQASHTFLRWSRNHQEQQLAACASTRQLVIDGLLTRGFKLQGCVNKHALAT